VGPGSGVTPHRDRWEREGKGRGEGERNRRGGGGESDRRGGVTIAAEHLNTRCE